MVSKWCVDNSITIRSHLVGMHLADGLHVDDLDFVRHHEIAHSDLLPASAFPEHSVQALQQGTQVVCFTTLPSSQASVDHIS